MQAPRSPCPARGRGLTGWRKIDKERALIAAECRPGSKPGRANLTEGVQAMILRAIDYIGARLMGRDAWRHRHYKLAKRLANRQGFEVYKPRLIWLRDEEFMAARDRARERSIDGGPSDRCYMLLEAARLVRGIEGDFAECGVRYGKSSLILLNGAGRDSTKRLHAFDSFEGLSDPGAGDLDASGKSEWEKGDLAVPEDIVRRNLSDFEGRVVLHKGWIPERFEDVADARFSLVHVDVDLHDPTRDAFAFFYLRMAPGGIMICDDYGVASCPGAKRAVDEFFADKPERVISLPTGQSMVFKL